MHPGPARCQQKQQLEGQIRFAMKQVIQLDNHDMKAVIAGDFAALPAIKSELVEARKQKDALLNSYYRHIREHGC